MVAREPATLIILPIQPIRILSTQREAVFVQTVHTGRKEFGFLFAGQPGRTYQVEASSEGIRWEAIGQVSLTNSLGQFFDPQSTNTPSRFYRLSTH